MRGAGRLVHSVGRRFQMKRTRPGTASLSGRAGRVQLDRGLLRACEQDVAARSAALGDEPALSGKKPARWRCSGAGAASARGHRQQQVQLYQSRQRPVHARFTPNGTLEITDVCACFVTLRKRGLGRSPKKGGVRGVSPRHQSLNTMSWQQRTPRG